MEQHNFVGTTHCGLCRLEFPYAPLPGLGAWQSDFRALLCFESDGKTSIEITNVATLDSLVEPTNVTLAGSPPVQAVTISHGLQHIGERPTEYAFCFHDWCYTILRWRVRGCTKFGTYRLVRTLALEPSVWGNMCPIRGQIDPEGSLRTLVSYTGRSSSGLQPPFLLKLPVELRIRIWEYVGLTTAYSAFILVAGETAHLLRSLHCFTGGSISLQQGAHLSAKTISVFGREYLQDLDNQKTSESDSEIRGIVTEVRFAARFGGVCAIKIVGSGWEKGWIGTIPDEGAIWYGICRTVSGLDCSYNDLHCTDISSPGPSVTGQILWDQPEMPASLLDPDAALFDFDRDLVGRLRPDGACPRRYFRHLPLFSGNEYILGLTVYLTFSGIFGLEAHFTSTSHLSGSRQGCLIHFPLRRQERIAYVWLRVANAKKAAYAPPAFAIQTTFGRAQLFGPHIPPTTGMRMKYKWILLKSQGCVDGFYYENPIEGPPIMRLGITSDGTSLLDAARNPQYSPCHLPSELTMGPGATVHFSVAVFNDLQRVELCRLPNRCTGLLIHYTNGFRAVIGQWHTSGASQHSCIYDSSGPSVDTVCFRITRDRWHSLVTDVIFYREADVVPCPNDFVFTIGEHMAWWFSQLNDLIARSDGEYLEITEEITMLQG